MLKHRFSQKFQNATQKKFFELKKKTHSVELKKRNRINLEFHWREFSNTNSILTIMWRNSRLDCVSERIFNQSSKTRMRRRSLQRRFVFWWLFRLHLISIFDNTMRSVHSSIVQLTKKCSVNVRRNFLDSNIVENWIKLCTI